MEREKLIKLLFDFVEKTLESKSATDAQMEAATTIALTLMKERIPSVRHGN